MNQLDLCYLPATELAILIAEKQLSPVEVLQAFLERIVQVNPAINAVCTVAAEQAMMAAETAEAVVMRGEELAPLHGVPVAVKDLTLTAGIRTTFGSEIYSRFVPEEDAAVVQRLKAAGAIIFCKTNTPEFGAGANTFNNVFGITRNPWNPALTPAGSSGGSAAALAVGLTPFATGSDLAGSLRTPASFCGVIGLRPTPNRISDYPATNPWQQLSVEGPMARTVADAALLFSVMSGYDERLPLSIASDPAEFLQAVVQPELRGWRVAWSPDLGFAPVDSEVVEICHQAAQIFGNELGCQLEEASPDLHDAPEIFQTLRAAAMAGRFAQLLPRWREKMQPNLVWNIEKGVKLSATEVSRAEIARGALWQRARRFFESHDLLLTPAAATLPFPVEVISPPEIAGRVMDNYVDWLGITYGITVAGLPAIVVPCGLSKEGLPVGLQIVGRSLGEAAILRAAAAFEKIRPEFFNRKITL